MSFIILSLFFSLKILPNVSTALALECADCQCQEVPDKKRKYPEGNKDRMLRSDYGTCAPHFPSIYNVDGHICKARPGAVLKEVDFDYCNDNCVKKTKKIKLDCTNGHFYIENDPDGLNAFCGSLDVEIRRIDRCEERQGSCIQHFNRNRPSYRIDYCVLDKTPKGGHKGYKVERDCDIVTLTDENGNSKQICSGECKFVRMIPDVKHRRCIPDPDELSEEESKKLVQFECKTP